MASQRDIYARHRGPFALLLTRETADKKGKITQTGDRLAGPFTAEEAHEEARMLVTDPRENVVDAMVFSNSEGQFIGAFYKRGTAYQSWAEMRSVDLAEAGYNDIVDDAPQTEFVGQHDTYMIVEPTTPKRTAAAPKVERAAGPPRKTGARLQADWSKTGWPASAPAQAVREFMDGDRKAGASEIVAALGAKLNELGVAHPASLVSRLKQAGFLIEAKDTE